MSLDVVDVVHELEDAVGTAEHTARRLADAVRDAAPFTGLATELEALAESMAATVGPDSALAEWRAQG